MEVIAAVETDGFVERSAQYGVDRDRKGDRAVATVDGLAVIDQRVVPDLGEHGVKAIVGVWLSCANSIHQLDIFDRMNGEVERDRTVAPVTGLQIEIIGELASGQRLYVEAVLVIDFPLTTHPIHLCGGRHVDGQEQRGSTVATVHIVVDYRVGA